MFKYIQAAPNSNGTVRIQAVTNAFPLGYMSGNVEVDGGIGKDECFVPSMRGSSRLYAPLTQYEDALYTLDGGYVCDVDVLNTLQAPSPAYCSSDMEAVTERVVKAIETAKAGQPKAESQVDAGALGTKLAEVIVAVLKDAGVIK